MIKDKKRYRILVVEDNAGDFILVEDYLNSRICSPVIVHAVNFLQAGEILSAGGAPFDVILLDLTLPDKSGQDLIAEMLQLSAFCPIIILTGYAEMEFSINSIALGVADYLLKDDLSPEVLYKSIIYSVERKKALAQLTDSEKRFSDLFQLSPQPMWVFDPETLRFIQVNRACTELYGYSEEEFLSMSLMDIKRKEDIEETEELIRSGRADYKVYKRTTVHRKKTGEYIDVEIYVTPIVINNQSLRSVIAIDITEKKLHECNILKAIIKTQEDERYEIGSELHDNVCQILAASQMYLRAIKAALSPSGILSFKDCEKNICLALEEIRNLSHRLAPAFLEGSTIEEAFYRLFDTFSMYEKLEILFYFDNKFKEYPIGLDLQLNIYRILQEQLRNILKYARATIVEVDVLIHRNRLKMRVSDNGAGFDVGAVKSGIGVANMKRRAELFAGKFEISSLPGKGCEIIVDIPIVRA